MTHMAGMAVDKDNHIHILEQEATQLEALQQNHLKMAVQKTQVSHSQTQDVQTQKVFSSHLEQTVR